jgi:hypothetical protein
MEEPAASIFRVYGAAGSLDTLVRGTKSNNHSHPVRTQRGPDPDTVLTLPVCTFPTGSVIASHPDVPHRHYQPLSERYHKIPIPMAARSKACICSPSLFGVCGFESRRGTSASCECCVQSGGNHSHDLISGPEDSYRMWCVYVRNRHLIQAA